MYTALRVASHVDYRLVCLSVCHICARCLTNLTDLDGICTLVGAGVQ